MEGLDLWIIAYLLLAWLVHTYTTQRGHQHSSEVHQNSLSRNDSRKVRPQLVLGIRREGDWRGSALASTSSAVNFSGSHDDRAGSCIASGQLWIAEGPSPTTPRDLNPSETFTLIHETAE